MPIDKKLISIIMPFKNEESYLQDCLNSILAQSINHWELIAIDDHSSDKSDNILKDYANQDSRIRYVINAGSGIINALRTGYELAQGQYLTRMDADDIMSVDKLEILSSNLDIKGDGYLGTGLVKYFSKNGVGGGYKSYEQWLNRLTQKGANYSDIYKECVIPSPCWLLSRSDFEKCGGFNSNVYPEDYDLCFRFYEAGLKVIPCNKVLHHWRDYPERSSRTDPNYSDNRFLKLKYHYFFNLDRNYNRTLVIWGAGKKGKELAKLLKNDNKVFHWICDNPKKIGKDIYGQILKPTDNLESYGNAQIILCVANKTEQSHIRSRIQESYKGADVYAFC